MDIQDYPKSHYISAFGELQIGYGRLMMKLKMEMMNCFL
jgi:hypothetical protein